MGVGHFAGNDRPTIAMEIQDNLQETWRELGAAVDGQRGLAFATGFISLVWTANLNMTKVMLSFTTRSSLPASSFLLTVSIGVRWPSIQGRDYAPSPDYPGRGTR